MIRPLHDHIVVRRDPAQPISSLVHTPLEDAYTGTVLAVGPGKSRPYKGGERREVMPVSVGDRVQFTGQFMTPVMGDGEPVYVMSWSSCVGVVEDAGAS